MKSGEKKYLSVTATAALVRKALREAFPGVVFAVRSTSYSGGASVSVRWMDGPRVEDVEAVAKVFQGGLFDGQTDYQGRRVHAINGTQVQFGATVILCQREYSEAFLASAMDRWDRLSESEQAGLLHGTFRLWGLDHSARTLRPTALGMASTLSDIEPRPSKTAQSVVLVRVY